MTTIATSARETHSQPHEIAALLDLGTDYADDQELTEDEVEIVAVATFEARQGRMQDLPVTAELSGVSHQYEYCQDTITICLSGIEIDYVSVEPSEHPEPYEAALRAAGYENFTWI